MKDDFKPLSPKLAFVPAQSNRLTPEENDTEPAFVPPEVLAARSDEGNEQDPVDDSPFDDDESDNTPAPKKPKQRKRKSINNIIAAFQRLSTRKQIIVVSALAGLLITIGGLVWWFVIKPEPPQPPPPIVQKQEEPPAPTTVPSRLTGMQIEPELNELPTTGVMIENSPDARPQSGLQEAGVVYEAISEGGITRFLALYLESKPSHIGPVRSVRPYYLDFLAPYDAPLAHAGGSAPALAQLRQQKFRDLEAFQNASTYQRVTNRYAPHNLYTSRDQLLALQTKKGWTKSTFTGFVRKTKEEPEAKPTAKSIDLKISSFLYNPRFDYDAKTNSYPRKMAGRPHIDEKTGKRIAPKVVIAIVAKHHYQGIYSVYGATGSGTAYIFQDGKVVKGVWEKRNRKDQYRFGDANGSPLALNAGQTWVSFVSSDSAVVYRP
jgi:hypothetical protein